MKGTQWLRRRGQGSSRACPDPEHRKRSGQRGQSLVEFALVMPLFVFILLAVIDFGLALHASVEVANAAREGARKGAVRAPESEIIQRVYDTAGSLNADQLSVTVTNAQGNAGESVVVEVHYTYELITPLASVANIISGGTLPSSIEIVSTADMRLEE